MRMHQHDKVLDNGCSMRPDDQCKLIVLVGSEFFFIVDPVHVFKRMRNNLLKSWYGSKAVRFVEIDQMPIHFGHIIAAYVRDNEREGAKVIAVFCLYLSHGLLSSLQFCWCLQLTDLNRNNVFLTSWAKMRVDYASHMLSEKVVTALGEHTELTGENVDGTKVRVTICPGLSLTVFGAATDSGTLQCADATML